LLRTLRQLQPDVVWFNLGFASFGDESLPAFLGIVLPALARAAGFDTHVTLHQLMETVDLKDAGIRFPLLYRLGGVVATQILLCAFPFPSCCQPIGPFCNRGIGEGRSML
jgi:hypothetical protein